MSLRPQYKSPAIIKTQSRVVDCGRVTTDDDLGIGSAAAVDCCLSPKRKTARCPAAAAAAAGIGGREGDISTETEEEEIPPCPAFFFFSPAPRWRPFSSPLTDLFRERARRVQLTGAERTGAYVGASSLHHHHRLRRERESTLFFFHMCSSSRPCRYDCCYVNWGIWHFFSSARDEGPKKKPSMKMDGGAFTLPRRPFTMSTMPSS